MQMKTPTCRRPALSSRESRQGFVLLDALVAIVIFSFGILGMVALQSSSIQLTSNANYRMNAAMLADQVIAQMWTDPANLASGGYAGTKGAGGTQYTAWLDTITCSSKAASTSCLPGVSTNPPSIVIGTGVTVNGVTDYPVTVTVNWQAPGDPNPHSYVSITEIGS
jgi:type IV pilus assembly protein PilV